MISPTALLKLLPPQKKSTRIKGLNYSYMESYIKAQHANLLTEFYELCGKDETGKKKELAAAASYGEVKMWCLIKCPEIEAMSDKVSKIVEEARKLREEKKSA